jgi:hypothetical protein
MAFKMGDVLIKCGQEIGPVGLVSIFGENFFQSICAVFCPQVISVLSALTGYVVG